jgi:hypothetical protein
MGLHTGKVRNCVTRTCVAAQKEKKKKRKKILSRLPLLSLC